MLTFHLAVRRAFKDLQFIGIHTSKTYSNYDLVNWLSIRVMLYLTIDLEIYNNTLIIDNIKLDFNKLVFK